MLHIQKPFLTAGYKYNWPIEFGNIGVGINLKYLNGSGNFEMTISDNKDIWTIKKSNALGFALRYDSFYQARTVKLAIIPWKMLIKKNNKNQEILL